MTTQTQQGQLLDIYCHVRARHNGVLVYEWVLELARRMHVGGGSAFRAVAGFGRHQKLREEQFFDLSDDLPIKIEFLVTDAQAAALLDAIRAEGVDVVYASTPASFGNTSQQP